MDVTSIMSHINDCRARHRVAPLLWSNELAQKAQDRVYIEMTLLAGSTGAGSSVLGLNLVTRINGNFSVPTEACIYAIDKWREEQAYHDLDKAGNRELSRNYGAIVWGSMTHVGFGVGRDNGGYTVAAVFEPGERLLVDSGSTVSSVPSGLSAALHHSAGGGGQAVVSSFRSPVADMVRAPSANTKDGSYTGGGMGMYSRSGTAQSSLLSAQINDLSDLGILGRPGPRWKEDISPESLELARQICGLSGRGSLERNVPSRMVNMTGSNPPERLGEDGSNAAERLRPHGGVGHVSGLSEGMGVSNGPGLVGHGDAPPLAGIVVAPSSVCVREDSVEIEELRSKNGRFRFVMQPDHILALYMENDAVWAIYIQAMGQPQPFPADGAVRLVLQTDGNLVALDRSLQQVWATDTANRAPGPYTLTMQDDGNCVLFAGRGTRLWATNTHGWGRDMHRSRPATG